MDGRTADAIAYALLAGAVLAGLALWPALPDRMAIHFDAGGTPDNVVTKPLAVVLAPVVGVAAVLVTRYAPTWANTGPASPRVETAAVLFVAGVVASLQGFVYAWNLGYRLDATVVVVPVLAAAALLVGYAAVVDRA
jgi:uncharacterized membrane protein